ncbi:MAG TPA: single-stranded DNA-binding protein [Desulfobacteraceae bacterium]|nr:single-stranded DNA-binding protein [Desulfobacteraceae bacterium]|tara:strand:+ start:493 stop:1008 length:516 start_codon:yes stop_codon:yes gene_type:complete
MAGLNKVMIIGGFTRDPELRYSQQGTAVVNASIATSEKWKDQNGQQQERTEYHRIVVFGKQAETIEKYMSKGSQIYIEGRLQTRNYEKDGQTHYVTEVVATNFQFLGGGNRQGGQGQHGGYQNQQNQGGGYQQQGQTQDNGQGFSQRPQYPNQGQGQVGGPDNIPDDTIPF